MANQILANGPQPLSANTILYVAPSGTASIYPALVDVAGNLIVPAYGYTFRSTNPFTATVSSSGVVTGVRVGQTGDAEADGGAIREAEAWGLKLGSFLLSFNAACFRAGIFLSS